MWLYWRKEKRVLVVVLKEEDDGGGEMVAVRWSGRKMVAEKWWQ